MLGDEIAAYVDQAVAKQLRSLQTAVGTVVTSPSQVSTDPLTVVIDGSALAVPVKGFRSLPIFPGARVALIQFGSDWTVIGAYTNPASGTGSSRIIIGADVPAELRTFGIDTAILTYITDVSSGLEVGYFFIGGSNRFDGGGTNRVQAFGNTVYPTPGLPSSATPANVKTNFQQGMFSPFPQTTFKDEQVLFRTDILLDPVNGMNAFQIAGPSTVRDVHFCIGEQLAEASSATPATSTATLVPGTLITLGSNSTSDYADVTATVDMHQTAAGNNTAIAELIVNGAAVTRQVIFAGNAVGDRATCFQQWRVPLPTVGTGHTFQLRVQLAGGAASSITAEATHTCLRAKMYQDI